MIRVKRRSYFVASASVFAALYAVLGLIPVSPYVGISSFLSFREPLAPLAGILFGPLTGGLSMVLGGFIDIGLRGTTNFDFLDFVPDLAAAVTAGFCFSGRRRLALGLPVVLLTIYLADPLSAVFVNVGGVAIPFVWMHALSIAALGAALLLEGSGRMTRTGVAFVGATVFASTMAAHAAGSILYENVLVRVNHILTYQSLQGVWVVIFSLYPAERVLFTVLGTAISVPVLRALTRRMRQEPTAA